MRVVISHDCNVSIYSKSLGNNTATITAHENGIYVGTGNSPDFCGGTFTLTIVERSFKDYALSVRCDQLLIGDKNVQEYSVLYFYDSLYYDGLFSEMSNL